MSRFSLTLLVPVVILSTAAVWSGARSPARSSPRDPGRASPSAGCRGRSPTTPGVSDQTMISGGVERKFQLTIPQNYDSKKPFPILFGLHPLSISNTFVSGMTGFADMAPRYNFIGVAPSGRLDGTIPFWLAAPTQDNYDVRFIGDLLDKLEREMCVDRARVYSTGMSNGAQMSSLLACRITNRITAVAPIAGVEFADECRGRPVPVIAFHGTADPNVAYGGGPGALRGRPDKDWPSVETAVQTWAGRAGCRTKPARQAIGTEVQRIAYRGCARGADVVLYAVTGGGHTWPGSSIDVPMNGHVTQDINAADLMLEFFSQHPPPSKNAKS